MGAQVRPPPPLLPLLALPVVIPVLIEKETPMTVVPLLPLLGPWLPLLGLRVMLWLPM